MAGYLRKLLPLAVALVSAIHAQTFDVASIKRNAAMSSGYGRVIMAGTPVRIAGNRVSARAISLQGLIQEAYTVRDYQIAGLPEWGRQPGRETEAYDVEATTEGSAPASLEQVRTMLQNLLAERFQLKLHHESRELPVYHLTVDKNGLKMRPVSATDPPVDVKTGPSRTPMSGLLRLLGVWVDHPIVDKTGLTGVYEYDVSWMLTDDADTVRAGMTALVPKYLGLRLEPHKDAVEVLVIDHAERPSEN